MRTMRLAVFAIMCTAPLAAEACPGTTEAPSFAMPSAGEIKVGFGYRTHPLLQIRKFHTGVDFESPLGTPVTAAASGEVAEAGYKGKYGYYVRIKHGAGYGSAYAHMKALDVRQGDCVVAGATLGVSGCTGLCSEPHLHFEVLREGQFVDPQLQLRQSAR